MFSLLQFAVVLLDIQNAYIVSLVSSLKLTLKVTQLTLLRPKYPQFTFAPSHINLQILL